MSGECLKIVFLLNTLLILIGLSACESAIEWSDHDISTLKLLQIVHRHGDRNPLAFAPKDPYQSDKYWKEGIGQLTGAGKYRMYSLGKFLREEYSDYLGDKYSPREVYARSSASHRCIESLSSLLAGLYPPNNEDWRWGNGTDPMLGQLWQPIPIETYMPKKNDIVLRKDKTCYATYTETEALYRSQEVQDFLRNKTELFERLSPIVGHTLDTIKKASNLHTTLEIEMSRGLYWSHVWTNEEQKEIVEQLMDIHRFAYRMDRNSSIIKRLRGGGLVKELTKAFRSVISEQNKQKVYIYSTHDSILSVLMKALDVYDGELPPFGATLLLELHQNPETEEYFVRMFYIRDTENGSAVPLLQGLCGLTYDCPTNQFFKATKNTIYDNFKKECKNTIDFQKFDFDDKLYFIDQNDL